MTREEAIEFGKRILLIATTDDDNTVIEFTKMAIQALSQEPKAEKPMCDRNICLSNEYNGIGCEECVVNKAEQEPTKREIEREYLFQSLCEDFKKLQAENNDLRKRLEQEPCEKCEVGNPCLYCKHEFEPQESEE